MSLMKVAVPGLGGLVTTLLALGVVKLVGHYQRRKKERQKYEKLIPKISSTADGTVKSIERFGDYVVRQLGLDASLPASKRLAKVAEDYLRGDKSQSDDSLDKLFDFLYRICSRITDDAIESLNHQCIQELDVCMVTYFSFHWHASGKIIDQVLTGSLAKKKSLKMVVQSEIRKKKFQRMLRDLKAQRRFLNLVEMMRAMGHHNGSAPDKGNVVVPADSSIRSPVLLFLGGGMGAGKSTAVKEVMAGPFWKGVSTEAVVVEADAFKENDVIYRALSSFGDRSNISEAAELVHESSTTAASSLLVTALNSGRDVILDGTMSWEPFVRQTVAMARDVHNRHYRMGPGYGTKPDGTVYENYWEPVEDWDEVAEPRENPDVLPETQEKAVVDLRLEKPLPVAERKPYRIEFLGVVCDAHLAVVRGMRRAILTKRGVPVRAQLRSHKLFSKSIERYCELMDQVKIYSTSAMGGPPELIAFKDGAHKLLKDCDEYDLMDDLISLNVDATSVAELYTQGNKTSAKKWHEFAFGPIRDARQALLAYKLSLYSLQHQFSTSESDLSSLGDSPVGSPLGGSSPALTPAQSSKSSRSTDSNSESFHKENGVADDHEGGDESN